MEEANEHSQEFGVHGCDSMSVNDMPDRTDASAPITQAQPQAAVHGQANR